MVDVFLSFAPEDLRLARSIASALEEQGWRVAWEEPVPGERRNEAAERELGDAGCVVVLWSFYSFRSARVRDHTTRAHRLGTLVFCTLEAALRLPPQLPVVPVDLSGWSPEVLEHPGFVSLTALVGQLTGKQAPSPADGTEPPQDPGASPGREGHERRREGLEQAREERERAREHEWLERVRDERERRPTLQPVWVGVSCPAEVAPEPRFVARFVAHAERLEGAGRDTAARILGPGLEPMAGVSRCRWKAGVEVTVRPTARAFAFHPPRHTFEWNGTHASIDFEARSTETLEEGTVPIRLDALVGGVAVAGVTVEVRVVANPTSLSPAVARARAASTAFASYATGDRDRVIARVSPLVDLVGLDVFLDALALHPCDAWKAEVAREIDARDLFLLFWSAAARASPWVDWEWRRALASRGLHGIQPQPLEDPARAPPPRELRILHFGNPPAGRRGEGSTGRGW